MGHMDEDKPRTHTRRTVLTDTATGEAREYLQETQVPPRAKDKRNRDAFRVAFAAGMVRLALMDLRGFDLKVLLYIAGHEMAWETSFPLYATEIANAFGVKQPAVSGATRRLRNAGVLIERAPKKYMIHPDYFWLGDAAARNGLKRELASD